MKPCDVCGQPFEAKRPTARYCSARCRQRARRSGLAGARAGAVIVPFPEPAGGPLVRALEGDLRRAGQLDTWQGQAALDLVRRLEASTADTGSSYAALHRELRAAVAEALKGANAPKSVLQQRRDELAARRAKRSRGDDDPGGLL
jgi:hypothetical protein